MKNVFILFLLSVTPYLLFAQIPLTMEGVATVNKETGTWYGVNIPRSEPTKLIYRNNAIESVNNQGYMLQAGDEVPSSKNNNLDGQLITGNKFWWKGLSRPEIITHGLFTGYNINSVVKYNYLQDVPYGIIFKSGTEDGQSMTFTSGGCGYNICKNGKFAIRMKGMSGVKVYNNTLYNNADDGRYLVLITSNQDKQIPPPSTGTKIFNNIFYAKNNIPMITIEAACLTDFESDYNVFWCEAGEPRFSIDGKSLTFTQWQALGYDLHSKVVNPNFTNTTTLVPSQRLDFGKDLGSDWKTGLSISAKWEVGVSPATTDQNGKWQVGAIVHSKPLSNIDINESDNAIGFKLFPNPSDGLFQILIEKIPSDGVTVEVKNINGQIIQKKKIYENLTQWSLKHFKNGVYIISVNDRSNVYTEKIITSRTLK